MPSSAARSSNEDTAQKQRSRARRANGIVAGLLAVFFLGAHGLLGSIVALIPLDSTLSWIAWIGTAAIAVHVGLNVRVTIEKLSDPEKPPSTRKKAKIALRWATGIVLVLAIGLHVASMCTQGADAAQSTLPGVAITIALIIAIAIHVCLCMKSLIRDLGGSKELKDRITPFARVTLCVYACLLCAISIAGYLQ